MNLSKRSWKKWAFAGVILLGLTIFIWSVIAASVSVGFSIGMAAPGALGIVLIGWAVWHLKYDKPVLKPKWLRVTIIGIVCVALVGILVLESLMTVAAVSEPGEAADTVIVLGCGIFPDGGLTVSLKNRLDTAYRFLTEHPNAEVIVSGGQGSNEPMSEAEAMRRYLESRGIDDARIYMEDQSTSTEENLEYSLEIAKRQSLGNDVAIVTSDYHIYRALNTARALGFSAYGIPSPTGWRIWLSCHVREWLAIIKTAFLPDFDIKLS